MPPSPIHFDGEDSIEIVLELEGIDDVHEATAQFSEELARAAREVQEGDGVVTVGGCLIARSR